MSKTEKCIFVAVRVVLHYFRDGLSRSAAELAFYLLFSLFPLIMVLNSLLAMTAVTKDMLLQAAAFLPVEVQAILTSYMEHLRSTPALRPLMVGSVLTLYFLSRAVRSMMHTLEDIYGRSAEKHTVRRIVISIFMTLLCLLMLASSLALIVLSQSIADLVVRWFPQTPVWRNIGCAIAAGCLLLFLLFCYRLLPGVPMRWRDAFPGAAASLGCWYVLTRGFAWYVDRMASYSLLYGSIGAVIVLMLWLNLSAMTLVLGAVLNYVLQIELQ